MCIFLTDTYATQLEWIQQIHTAMRSYWTDLFFLGWKYVDTIYFSILLIATVWYIFHRKIGIQLFYILFLSGICNEWAKAFFALPRPCQIDPYVGIYYASSYGFPSGAAQTAVLLAGIVFLESKNKVFRRFIVLFALLFSFSRVYLGVHFPTDILGGWIVGALLLLVYAKLFPLLEKQWKLWIFFFPILTACLQKWDSFGHSLGVALGLLAFSMYGWKTLQLFTRYIQLLSVLVGVAICFILLVYLPAPWKVPLSCMQGFWFSYLGGWWVAKLLR